MSKQLAFSVTRDEFKVEAFRASGPGGQNRNKVETAIRITHIPSGAIGLATEERSQYRNRITAFRRCVHTPKFQAWVKMRLAGVSTEETLDKVVQHLMAPENLKVECQDESGEWVPFVEEK